MKASFILIVSLVLLACQQEPDHIYREAVRQYLKEKGNSPVEEKQWYYLDSVFSPNTAQIAADYYIDRAYKDIDELLFELSYERYGTQNYKALSKSIDSLNTLIKTYKENLEAIKRERKKNRVGITLSYIDADHIDREYTFVFTNDLKKVDHVISYFGVTVTIYPKLQK